MDFKTRINLIVSDYELLVSDLSKNLKGASTSQAKMAKKLGVNPNTLTNWKKNPLGVPPCKLKKLAKFV